MSNGENIEPSPIEDAILSQSSLIEQILLAGQDGRSLVALLVLNPNELALAGFLEEKVGKDLLKQNEAVNDPKCTEDDCKKACEALSQASETLRQNTNLKNTLLADVKAATENFRAWERVQNIRITLEPFAMSNGLLTQSYKVKRDAVANRYVDLLS